MLDIREREVQNHLRGIDIDNKPIKKSHSTVILHHEAAKPKLDKDIEKNVEVSRKRKRSLSWDTDSGDCDLEVEAQSIDVASKSSKPPAPSRFESVRIPDLNFPKSAYQGHSSTLPVSCERDVLHDFLVSKSIILTMINKTKHSFLDSKRL